MSKKNTKPTSTPKTKAIKSSPKKKPTPVVSTVTTKVEAPKVCSGKKCSSNLFTFNTLLKVLSFPPTWAVIIAVLWRITQ